MDEFRVHILKVGENQELFKARVIAHVAVFVGIGVTPFTGGLTEERDVEQIGFVGVREGCLLRRNFRRDEMGQDGVGVEAMIDFGQGAVEVPGERQPPILVLLEALEWVWFDFVTQNSAKLKIILVFCFYLP